ncbi:MAG: TolC family protein [Deltaproteobacteria bacterium]|nr:TolC family protein [Deltaproteobacteria bacterium]
MRTLVLSVLMSSLAAAAAPAPEGEVPPPLTRPAPDGPVLSFADALAAAKVQAPDLKVARERYVQSQDALSKAYRAFHPILSAGANYTRNSTDASFQVGGQTVTTQELNALSANLTGTWSVFDYRRYPALDNAKDQQEVARLSETQLRRELLLNVAATYLLATQTKKLADAAYALSDSRRNSARQALARFSAGVLQRAALVRAQLDVVQADGQAQKSYFDSESAKSQLATLLNRRDAAFDVAEPAQPPPELQGEFNELLQKALNERPEIASAKLNEQIAARVATDAWAQFLPKLDLRGQANYQNAAGLSGSSTTWALTLALTVPLYDGGFRYVQLKDAESQKRQAKAQTESQVAKIEDELRRGQLDLRAARVQLETATKALQLAQENDALVRAQFEAGTSTQIEVSDAGAALFQSQADLLRQKLEVQVASLRLAKAVGAFDP